MIMVEAQSTLEPSSSECKPELDSSPTLHELTDRAIEPDWSLASFAQNT